MLNDSAPSIVVHVAGMVVATSHRVIQRCAVCGLSLRDSIHEMGISHGDSPPEVRTWEVNRLIAVQNMHSGQSQTIRPKADELPWNCCINFLPANE